MIFSWCVAMPSDQVAGWSAGPDGGLTGAVTGLVDRLGGPGAGLAVALENVFPPIPSEAILPLAGFAASRGTISLAAAIGWTTLGSVVGALVIYGFGAAVGWERVRAAADRVPLVQLADVDRTRAWFTRHGTKAVLFGRMAPVFRSLISLPAGVERMPVGRFTVLTALGSLVWNTVFVISGYLLGENWRAVEETTGRFQNLVAVGCVAVIAGFAVHRLRRHRSRTRSRSRSRHRSVPTAGAGTAPDAPSRTEQVR